MSWSNLELGSKRGYSDLYYKRKTGIYHRGCDWNHLGIGVKKGAALILVKLLSSCKCQIAIKIKSFIKSNGVSILAPTLKTGLCQEFHFWFFTENDLFSYSIFFWSLFDMFFFLQEEVTLENIEEYVDLVTDFCLNSGIRRQLDAFRGKTKKQFCF